MRVEGLLQLPVRAGNIELGRSVDVILDPTGSRVLGLDVLCRDGSHRYLPLATANIGDDGIEVDSALVLLDLDDRSFYRREATSLRELMSQKAR
jgi:hypothetical protein